MAHLAALLVPAQRGRWAAEANATQPERRRKGSLTAPGDLPRWPARTEHAQEVIVDETPQPTPAHPARARLRAGRRPRMGCATDAALRRPARRSERRHGATAAAGPAPRTSPLRRFRGLVVIAAIVVVVAVVGVVFRDRITGNAGSLQVGDCFDLPADAVAATDATVGDVQHHPCTEAHGGEVFAVLTYPAAATRHVPADGRIRRVRRPAVRVELPVVHGRRPGRLHVAQRRLLLPPRHRLGER